MKAKVYKLGKTEFAISKTNETSFQVMKKVRGKWQIIDNVTSFHNARLSIFHEFAVDKGMVAI